MLEIVYRSLAAAEISKKRNGHYLCMLGCMGWILLRHLTYKADTPQDVPISPDEDSHMAKIIDRVILPHGHRFLHSGTYRLGGH
jgi:hypothetical protein